MRRSGKTALAALLLASSAALAAEPVTAEQVVARYRQSIPTIGDLDCPPANGDEVVICGRRESTQRLPLPVEEEPGRHIPGEAQPPDALAPDKSACVSNKGCAKATIPLIRTGRGPPGAPDPVVDILVDTIGKILTPD